MLLDAVGMIVDKSDQTKGYIQIFNTINRVNTFLPKRLGQCSRQETSGKNSLKKQTIDVGGRNRHGQKKVLEWRFDKGLLVRKRVLDANA